MVGTAQGHLCPPYAAKTAESAVTCYREGKLVFFDAMTGKILTRLAVAPEPYGIVADAKGKIKNLDTLKAELPVIGKQCGGCHETFRIKKG